MLGWLISVLLALILLVIWSGLTAGALWAAAQLAPADHRLLAALLLVFGAFVLAGALTALLVRRTLAAETSRDSWRAALGERRAVRFGIGERALALAVILALAGFLGWFFFFAGSSLPRS